MTEEQRAEAMRLMVSMPFLGGHFTPMNGDNFAEGLLANLQDLRGSLKWHAEIHNELVEEVQKYRDIIRAFKSVANLMATE